MFIFLITNIKNDIKKKKIFENSIKIFFKKFKY